MATHNGSQTANSLDTSKLECGICYELLLDPVVGNCGHDFCRNCLDKWRAQQRQQGLRVRCPVCRGVFADTFEKLGVCVRLRDMVELLFPDKIAQRRAELNKLAAQQKKRTVARVQQEEIPEPAPRLATDSPRSGRRRLHARRHHQLSHPAGSAGTSSVAAAAGSTFSDPSSLSSPFSNPVLQLQLQAAISVAARATEMHQRVAAGPAAGPGVTRISGAAAAAAGGLNGGSSRWPILDVHFTMGWYNRHEPGWRRACRYSSRSSGGRLGRNSRRRRVA